MNNVGNAATLFEGIELVERAVNGMYADGCPKEPLEYLAELIADLKHEYDELPDAILNATADAVIECPTCRHSSKDRDMLGRKTYACTAPNGERCPVARACGFRDPRDPADGISEFLKRQSA